uniref:Histone deacetylase n=1 Tax=candidate division WOR-3 bacterium TaxID=2052148 RepID=A0A7C4UDF3_UNCW3
MKVVYSDSYFADIGNHVFPAQKYRLVYEELIKEKVIDKDDIVEPVMPSREELLDILDEDYLDDLFNARLTKRTMFSEMPVKKDVIFAQILSCGGSYVASRIAIEKGCCYHIGGGFHHAFKDHAEGFCYVNDIVYAGVKILKEGIKRIAVIDCDLHQGNGTANFFKDEKRVFTFSIHQERLYPVKEKSDLDIGLDEATSDDDYLDKLRFAIDYIDKNFSPEFIIYQAGADPYKFDLLGDLSLTMEGLRKRDEMVIGYAYQKKIPIVSVLGGGYAKDTDDTIKIHMNTAIVMKEFFG